MSWLASLFSTPARQALGWTALGILGVIFAALGTWLLISGSDDAPPASPGSAPPTATATPSPTQTPRPSPSPTATPADPSPTATPTPRQSPGPSGATGGSSTGGQSGGEPPPAPTPTPEPAAARPYCPPASVGPGTLPTARVAGALTRAGVPVPAGSLEVFVTFDGVPGPSRLNVDGGFGIDFYSAGADCANRVGAVIGVLVEGRYFPSDYTVGSQPALVVVNVDLP